MKEHSSKKAKDNQIPSIVDETLFEPMEHKTYQRIQEEMRNCALWGIDQASLVRQMQEQGPKPPPFRLIFPINLPGYSMKFATSALAACIALFLCCCAWSWMPDPVSQVKFISEVNQQEVRVPWLWRIQLQMGYAVPVPHQIRAEIHLKEGSEIQCAPETRIALHIDRDRMIKMHSGHITVSAAHLDGSQMKVHTPLFDVVVVGTKFEVELTPKP